jgi:hypothetical protein
VGDFQRRRRDARLLYLGVLEVSGDARGLSATATDNCN